MKRLKLRINSYKKEYINDMKIRRFVYLSLWCFLFFSYIISLLIFEKELQSSDFYRVYNFALMPLAMIFFCFISIFVSVKYISKFTLKNSLKYSLLQTVIFATQIMHAIYIFGERQEALVVILMFIFIPVLFSFSITDILYRYFNRSKPLIKNILKSSIVALFIFMSYNFYFVAFGIDFVALEDKNWNLLSSSKELKDKFGDKFYTQTKIPTNVYYVDKDNLGIYEVDKIIGVLIRANNDRLYFRDVNGKLVYFWTNS